MPGPAPSPPWPPPSPPPAVLVGLDPGQHVGYAEADAATGALVAVESAAPLAAMRRLEALAAEGRLAGLVIEDARGLPLYARHRGLPREARDRAARSVGRIDALTDLFLDVAEALRVPVVTVEPARSGKLDAEAFRRLFGWTARTNEHGRDAARLVAGRTSRALAVPLGAPSRTQRRGGTDRQRPASPRIPAL